MVFEFLAVLCCGRCTKGRHSWSPTRTHPHSLSLSHPPRISHTTKPRPALWQALLNNEFWRVGTRAVAVHGFQREKIDELRRHRSGSLILGQCGSVSSSGSRALMTKTCKRLQLKEKTQNFCCQKLQFMKDHPSYRRSLQPSKENMQALQNM